MFKSVCEAKVGDDDIPVPIEEEILKFQITMDDFFLVNVPDGGYELGK